MGDSVIIRCIYKSGTTFPARLLSITSHCIIVPCQICQLTLALLIKWTTQGRWTVRKQPVIFPVIISLFGSLHLAASFPHDLLSPQHRGKPVKCTCGEKEEANGGERKDKICRKPHLELSASPANPITAFRGRGVEMLQEKRSTEKTTLLSTLLLHCLFNIPPALIPPFACLGNCSTTKIHRQLQLLPLSLDLFTVLRVI